MSVKLAVKTLKSGDFHVRLGASTNGRKTHFATVRSIVHYDVAMGALVKLNRWDSLNLPEMPKSCDRGSFHLSLQASSAGKVSHQRLHIFDAHHPKLHQSFSLKLS